MWDIHLNGNWPTKDGGSVRAREGLLLLVLVSADKSTCLSCPHICVPWQTSNVALLQHLKANSFSFVNCTISSDPFHFADMRQHQVSWDAERPTGPMWRLGVAWLRKRPESAIFVNTYRLPQTNSLILLPKSLGANIWDKEMWRHSISVMRRKVGACCLCGSASHKVKDLSKKWRLAIRRRRRRGSSRASRWRARWRERLFTGETKSVTMTEMLEPLIKDWKSAEKRPLAAGSSAGHNNMQLITWLLYFWYIGTLTH